MIQQVMTAPYEMEFREVEKPKAAPGQVVLRIRRIGICGSDIHVYHGKHPFTSYPVTQGHEVSGEIVEIGEGVEGLAVGQKVTVEPQVVCGKCHPCRHGKYNLCENLKVMGFQTTGTASEYFAVDAAKITTLPDDMGFDEGAMLEPLAVAVHAVGRIGNVKGMKVAVLGAGPIGNLVAQFCMARGANKVLITDISDLRLQKAKECGIPYTANVMQQPLKEAVKEVFGDEGYQVGFEVAGVESSVRSLMETIEKGSDIVIVAVFAKDPALSMFFLGEHELRLIGTMMYRHEDYETAVDFVSRGIIHLEPLISNRFAFEQYAEAYQYIDDNRASTMKVIIDVNS